ncbi:MAG: glutathione synthase, partial [Gammaproteobacteria bacterium]
MNRHIGVIMDPISQINIKKDSSFAMLLAAQARGYSISYMEQGDLFLRDGITSAEMRSLKVIDNSENWFELGTKETRPLSTLDAILMRLDPPFNMEYIYTTYLLEQAESAGVLV